MLSRAEVLNYLGCDSKTLSRLIAKKELTLYKIGGAFERFNKEEVVRYRLKHPVRVKKVSSRGLFEKAYDVWRYNNFYIVTFIILLLLLFFFYYANH